MQNGASIGPLASKAEIGKVQRLINKGNEEGAGLIAGGPGRLEGMPKDYFVRPTGFACLRNNMAIAREEIFVHVFSTIPVRMKTMLFESRMILHMACRAL